MVSTLHGGTALNHVEDVICLNCFHSYSTEKKLIIHYNVCINHNYCSVEMPKEKRILKYNHGEKAMTVPFITTSEGIKCLPNKIHTCIITLKIHQRLKKMSIKPLVIHSLHIIHLILQKET